MKTKKKKKYYNVKETAKILRVSQSTLYRRTRNQDIKSVKFGSRVLYRMEDIEKSVVEALQN